MNIEKETFEKIALKYDVTVTEVEMVYESIKAIGSHILMIAKLNKLTLNLIHVRYELLEMAIQKSGRSLVLIEIEPHRRPDAKARRIIIARLNQIKNLIGHVAFGNGKNMISEDAILFLMSAADITNYSVHNNREEAIEKLESFHSNYLIDI